MDIFSTFVLNRTVEHLERPASFLLNSFFGSIQTEESEEIHFDIDKSKPRLAPFVSPLIAGKVVANEGFMTKSFKPAYVKDKRRFDANAPLKRSIGETIGGSLPAGRRLEAAISRALHNQLENLTRREEVMAAEALCKGKITVTGEDYPTVEVDFQRDEALTIILTGTTRWSNDNVNVLEDIEDWAALIQEKSGAVARTIIMDPKAWRLFKNKPIVKEMLDIRRGTNSSLSITPIVRGQGAEKARYGGAIGDFDFYVYNDVYVDDSGEIKTLLPPNTVIIASREQIEGTRCYGVIQDEKAGYRAQHYFTKSWVEEDPAVRWLLMQSAPLLVPYRPNASFCATVA
ncbi:capsid protein of prophage [endosymbiont of Acanthamoeba sp. UWC8]|uniref:major capsid protein n=1 Tax=endosymbiont of Acanthamoeba sp. UWC8 TaxID=86106 RepID=UPI0004D18E54|nr:major capsid protein [endosymbiont of Acanthamoeba sp. UWC8]AIF81422.1 capsid protein of prophage [endosymbiont of Acanthamoeba sp. UWC8]